MVCSCSVAVVVNALDFVVLGFLVVGLVVVLVVAAVVVVVLDGACSGTVSSFVLGTMTHIPLASLATSTSLPFISSSP